MKQLRQYSEYCLIFLLFTVPLTQIYVSELFFPHVLGKNLLFRFVIELSVIFFCIAIPIGKPLLTKLSISGGILLLSMSVSNFFGVDFDRSLWSTAERQQGFIAIIHYIAYFLMLSKVVCPFKNRWVAYLGLMSVVSLVSAVYGIASFDGLMASFFWNKSYAASYLLMGSFFTLIFAKMHRPTRYLSLMSFCVQAYAMYLADNRGSMIAMASASYIGLACYFLKKKIAIVVISVGVLAGLVVAVSNEKYMSNERIPAWRVALIGATERPLLGWGQGNFEIVFDKYHKSIKVDRIGWWDDAHNMLVTVLIEFGLMGLIFFLIFCFMAAKTIKDSDIDRVEKILWGSLSIAFFVKAMFFLETMSTSIGAATIMAFVWSQDKHGAISGHSLLASTEIAIAAAMLLYCTAFDMRAYSSFKYLLSCDKSLRYKIDGFKKYFSSPPKSVNYTRMFFLEFAGLALTTKGIGNGYKKEIYDIAKKEMDAAFENHPGQKKLRSEWDRFNKSIGLTRIK